MDIRVIYGMLILGHLLLLAIYVRGENWIGAVVVLAVSVVVGYDLYQMRVEEQNDYESLR